MKRFTKLFLLSLLAAVLLCASTLSAFAATVNGKEVSVDSTVTYTFSISDAHQKITGIHMVLFFDPACLELQSVNADNLSGSTINEDQNGNGQIVIVNGLINGASGLKCEDKTALVTATFKVIADGDTEVSYYIPYLYDFDMVNIYDYKLTCDLAVDGETVVADETPVLHDVSSIDGFDAGDFENNEEGTGSGKKPEVQDNVGNQQGQNNQSAGNSAASSGNKDTDNSTLITIIVACVIVAAIIALAILKVVSSKKNPQKETNDINE